MGKLLMTDFIRAILLLAIDFKTKEPRKALLHTEQPLTKIYILKISLKFSLDKTSYKLFLIHLSIKILL